MDNGNKSWTVDINPRVGAKNASEATKDKSWMVYVECGVNTSTISADVKNWMADLECRVKDVDISAEEEPWKSASIYKLPVFAKELNPKAFIPEMVSFGPHHHDNDELKPLAVHKERALVHFVRRTRRPFAELVNAVKSVLPTLQDSYYRLDEKWRADKDGFLKLMITDGGFMLEVLLFVANNGKDYSPSDPFFSMHGIRHKMPYIRRDMLLIENQLPLLLLKTMVSVQNPELPAGIESMDHHIHRLVLNFLTTRDDSAERKNPLHDSVVKMGLRHHALDLIRQSLINLPLNTDNHNKKLSDLRKERVMDSLIKKKSSDLLLEVDHNNAIRCAVELHESGIHFKKSKTKSFTDISFNPLNGILCLPRLAVDDATECTLLNLMAYEHLHVNIDHDVTSYVCFMDEIINTANDVSLLHTKGIIQNSLGSDKNVAKLFNKISKEMTVNPESPLIKVREQINVYCHRRWNRWKANLVQTYFRSPWSTASLAAAVLLIVLTIIQTGFTIYQSYK